MHDFRFKVDYFWISTIFKSPKIQPHYKDALDRAEPLIKRKVNEYREYAISLINSTENAENEHIIKHNSNDDLVLKMFESQIQRRIMYLAIDRILHYGSLNVEENIIYYLDNDIITKEVDDNMLFNCFAILLSRADRHLNIIERLNKHFNIRYYPHEDLID